MTEKVIKPEEIRAGDTISVGASQPRGGGVVRPPFSFWEIAVPSMIACIVCMIVVIVA